MGLTSASPEAISAFREYGNSRSDDDVHDDDDDDDCDDDDDGFEGGDSEMWHA